MAEIRGLDVFAKHFIAYRDQYVLIGGVASWLTMDEAGGIVPDHQGSGHRSGH